ncbi:hypothetical protein BDZ89DRAFT_1066611, partial [Hymenopellis radicata]
MTPVRAHLTAERNLTACLTVEDADSLLRPRLSKCAGKPRQHDNSHIRYMQRIYGGCFSLFRSFSRLTRLVTNDSKLSMSEYRTGSTEVAQSESMMTTCEHLDVVRDPGLRQS